MLVVCAFENAASGQLLATQSAVRQHTLNSQFHGEVALLGHQGAILDFLQVADVLAEDKDGDIYPLVKAADKLSAYIKCIEERKAGNNEFLSAEAQTRAALEASPLPEVQYFLEHFIPAFERDLDELGAIGQ